MGYSAEGARCVAVGASDAPSRTVERESDDGLIGAGIGLIIGGYLMGAITGVVLGQQRTCGIGGFGDVCIPTVPNWAWGFVPFLAGMTANGAYSSPSVHVVDAAIGVGVVSALLEVAGIVALVVGAVGHEVRPGERADRGWRLAVGAPGADLGLSLRGSW